MTRKTVRVRGHTRLGKPVRPHTRLFYIAEDAESVAYEIRARDLREARKKFGRIMKKERRIKHTGTPLEREY